MRLPAMLSPRELAGLVSQAPGAAWLDSSDTSLGMGRFSFVGVDPFLVLSVSGGCCTLTGQGTAAVVRGDPWVSLGDLLRRHAAPAGPFPMAHGGAVGFIGYDMGRYLERLPSLNQPDEETPEAHIALYDLLVVVDHGAQETWLVSAGQSREGTGQSADRRLAQLRGYLERASAAAEIPAPAVGRLVLHGGFSRASYGAAVICAKDYIAAGDIYQVNLSQRFWVEYPGDPLALYGHLREATPVPFGGFLRAGDLAVLCLSPERFLRVQGSFVETRPIKGTRPRGRTRAEDRRLARELTASEKDRAELMMVVDLERNDLSRVCLPGTIEVPRLCALESYANVHHLVATVTGVLRPGQGVVDLLRAAFPGGSITGVPKIRAMEIIEEIEPVRRGIYTGCLGWIGFDGDADLNIVIRTAWARGGRLSFQAGGAVTIDSDPDAEYEETLHKAAGMLRAFGHGGRLEVDQG